MAAPTRPVAIVTGGNKGLGLETCRQLCQVGYSVILTARDSTRGQLATAELRRQGHDVTCRQLDISLQTSIDEFSEWAAVELPRMDVLVNNAAIALEGFDAEVVRQTIATNFVGTRDLTDAVAEALSPNARIVMVSSGLGALAGLGQKLRRILGSQKLTRGQLSETIESFAQDVAAGRHQGVGWPSSAYNVSKIAVNCLTRLLATELAPRGIMVNAVCPGWVRTDMGGRNAARSTEDGARGIVWAADLESAGPTGSFFRDRRSIDW